MKVYTNLIALSIEKDNTEVLSNMCSVWADSKNHCMDTFTAHELAKNYLSMRDIIFMKAQEKCSQENETFVCFEYEYFDVEAGVDFERSSGDYFNEEYLNVEVVSLKATPCAEALEYNFWCNN